MKRFIFLLTTIFICIGAYAETVNLTWGVDNETYYTSTCNVGDNITLPTEPTKYGYDFTGWQPIFYRGTFATWDNIPTNEGGYIADTFASTTPNENDYIIVNDSSSVPEYGENIEIQVSTSKYYYSWTDYCRTYIDGTDYGCNLTSPENIITISGGIYSGSYGTQWKSYTKDTMYKGTKYTAGNVILTLAVHVRNNGTYYAKFINSYPYSGKWLLRYHGNWNDLNRGGWIAEKKVGLTYE